MGLIADGLRPHRGWVAQLAEQQKNKYGVCVHTPTATLTRINPCVVGSTPTPSTRHVLPGHAIKSGFVGGVAQWVERVNCV